MDSKSERQSDSVENLTNRRHTVAELQCYDVAFFVAGILHTYNIIAEYFKNEMGYDIPPMTPFVGRNFNVTRAGIHADGLLKDQEIYNIFNTEKLLGKPFRLHLCRDDA